MAPVVTEFKSIDPDANDDAVLLRKSRAALLQSAQARTHADDFDVLSLEGRLHYQISISRPKHAQPAQANRHNHSNNVETTSSRSGSIQGREIIALVATKSKSMDSNTISSSMRTYAATDTHANDTGAYSPSIL